MPYKTGITTIQLTPETREKLKAVGKKGETYETILLRLLSSHKK
ncbi:MAG: hypothetical protein Q7R70_02770 [Candidatus Diapherotrites archaeon]|nr:hypothetical protein [Candidatus Diapherotrites archaeon]